MKAKKVLLGAVCAFISLTANAQQLGNGYATSIDNFNSDLTSGFYYTNKVQSNYPGEVVEWPYKHLLVMKTNDPNMNFQLQISSNFLQDDNRLFFRKLTDKGVYTNWHELATRGSNTFKGNQYIMGGLGIGDSEDMPETDRISLSYWRDKNSDLEKHGFLRYPKQFWIYPNTKSNGEGIHFNHNAEVGIGIAAQQGIRLNVNGTVRAKEIVVETFGADFVFESDYRLRPLSEVKAHIEENKHLPEIPSATQMQENGVGVSELSIKLLQKVEELTLYAIQQNETIEKLNKRIEELENTK